MQANRVYAELDAAFDAAVERAMGTLPRVTVLFSGGVDSALVASAARRYAEVELLTVGLPGSTDPVAARSAARQLGLPVSERSLEASAVRALVTALDLQDEPEPRRSVLVSLAAAFSATEGRRLLLGQGADELFGGYAHFRGVSRSALEERRQADWRRLRDVDWPATEALARRGGHRLGAPFLDAEFAAIALAIPLEEVPLGGLTKPVLRRWAVHRGLPPSIAGRAKRAMQYGTGIAAAIRAESRATPRPP